MSIVIYGIEMPDKHFIDGFYIDGEDGKVMNLDRNKVIGKAIELPDKHGRLVDADAMIKAYCNSECRPILRCEDDCSVYDMVKYAHTVIEAEGSGQ